MDELIIFLPDVLMDQVLAPEYKNNASRSLVSFTGATKMAMEDSSQPYTCTGAWLVLEAIA